MGSTVSIAVALLLTGVVFLLLPQYAARLADESGSLVTACLLSAVLAALADACIEVFAFDGPISDLYTGDIFPRRIMVNEEQHASIIPR